MRDFSGLLIASAYAVAAMFSIFLATQERKRQAPAAGIVLLFLLGGVLWLFGLQEASGVLAGVTEMAREVAREDNWYARRRGIQWVIVSIIPPIGAVGFFALLWLVRREWRRYLAVIFALSYLVCFGAVQAISLHQIDSLLRQKVLDVRIATWGDFIGLGLTVLALFVVAKAGRRTVRQRSQRPPPVR